MTAVPERSHLAVDFVNAVRAPVAPAYVRSVLRKSGNLPEVAARLPAEQATVAVRLTDDVELRRLHREYSGEDSITDVLSFAGTGDHLGDLAISWEAVVRQAARHRYTPQGELALLCVHGLLHLLGWDHTSRAETAEMRRLTRAALALSEVALPPGRF